jgi:hypothetical protein
LPFGEVNRLTRVPAQTYTEIEEGLSTENIYPRQVLMR